MKYATQIFLFLFILGIIFVGCYLKLDSKAKPERYTGSQIVTVANQATPEVESYFMVGENALPQIPGRIYVLKTESTAQIWHTVRAITKSRNGEQISVKGPELSERQEINLLNTGIPPAGWEVVYVDENGNPTHRNR